jgi:hypothetical protein
MVNFANLYFRRILNRLRKKGCQYVLRALIERKASSGAMYVRLFIVKNENDEYKTSRIKDFFYALSKEVKPDVLVVISCLSIARWPRWNRACIGHTIERSLESLLA